MRTADETAENEPERGVVIDLKSYRRRSRRARQGADEGRAARSAVAGAAPAVAGRGPAPKGHPGAASPHRRPGLPAAEEVAEHLDPSSGPHTEPWRGAAAPRPAPARPVWAYLFWATLIVIWGAAMWMRRR